MMEPMYSTEWFETFAATVPAALVEADLQGIIAALPLHEFPRVLDVGCGIGRLAAPLAARGYEVTGLDISIEALRMAKQHAPEAAYIALDQRHIGRLRWQFDGALLLWNSLGFVGRSTDLETLSGIARVIRPEGRVVFDLYHPDWLQQNQRARESDDRGASVRRWMSDRRCMHEIRYPNGRVDDIQFEVYQPEEIDDLCRRAGLEPIAAMTRWSSENPPSSEFPRYQLVCTRRSAFDGRE
jgi:SAM-dependent methyltransferase